MVSYIDPTQPEQGFAATASVRANFAAAASEIEALQNRSIDVTAFGAKGDGVTDDTAAIQAVLDAYAGKAVVLIPNTGNKYIITGLTIPSFTHLILNGYLLMKPGTDIGGTGAVNLSNNSNIVIEGYGIVDANDPNFTGNVISAGLSSGGAPGCEKVRVSGISISDAHYWNLNITQSENVVLRDVNLIGGHSANEIAAQCNDCWMINCNIDGTGNGDYGFCFYGGITNSGIIGCVVKNAGLNTPDGPPGIGVMTDQGQPNPCSNIVIANNIVHDCAAGGVTILGTLISGSNVLASGVVVTGNRLYNNCRNSAEAGQTADVYIDFATDILVSGNSISDGGSPGVSVDGVLLGPTASYVKVSGNKIFNVGQDATQTNAGIWLNSASGVIVSDNHFYDNRSTPLMQYAMVGAVGVACAAIGNYTNLPIEVTWASDSMVANYSGGGFAITSGRLAVGSAPVGYTNAAGLPRWYVGNTGSTESGGDTGSDFAFYSVDDGSGLHGQVLLLNRATALATFGGSVLVNGSGIAYGTGPGSNAIAFKWTSSFQAALYVDGQNEGNIVTNLRAGLAFQPSYANDAAAAAGGVSIDQLYRNGSVVQVRVT